uniref:C-type lectin domain-containing protein n=1 Tax=Nothobranchius furzeri TaxID=105023 RepID=A0A8C6LEL0_NOTFU
CSRLTAPVFKLFVVFAIKNVNVNYYAKLSNGDRACIDYELKTWLDAQQYCREKYTDLATMESLDDLSRMKANFSYTWAWIGLRDDPKSWKGVMGNDTNSWRWSATGKTSETGFCMWLSGDPNNVYGNELCVAMYKVPWIDVACGYSNTFICYNGKKIL